jgi:hypothetical protein
LVDGWNPIPLTETGTGGVDATVEHPFVMIKNYQRSQVAGFWKKKRMLCTGFDSRVLETAFTANDIVVVDKKIVLRHKS